MLSEFFAALLGAGAAYLFDLRRAARERDQLLRDAAIERRATQASVATALLLDLQSLEPMLRVFYHSETPAHWVGQSPELYFDTLHSEMKSFSSPSIQPIDTFYRQARDVFSTIIAVTDAHRNDEDFKHRVRCKAGFALRSIGSAKEALLREGGSLPHPRILESSRFPHLPPVPPRSFPETPGTGVTIPEQLE